ncbi:hypothetical protein RF55_10890 [Lasius niger]|uniref:Uncharacterized protein n=1 Tax=Lasius niger TaxID=67767 RepID=A0A0J7KGS5_LASNI|nr:hypothetical protein RF55_10890 [Lasius niger]
MYGSFLKTSPKLFQCVGFATLLASFALFSGCADQDDSTGFAPACPEVEVPLGTGDIYTWEPGKDQDLSHLIQQAQIIEVNGVCREGKPDSKKRPMTRVDVSISFRVDRGPASQSDHINLPYFIAAVKDGKIINKQVFPSEGTLSNQNENIVFKAPVRYIDLPAGSDPQVNDYTLMVGFQLTEAQLKYNREHMEREKFTRHGF